MEPMKAILDHYRALWKMGIRADIRGEDAPLEGYSLVVCPETFMFRDGFAERLREYVKNGGKLLVTCFTGVVDGDDLCWTGGTPHGLTDVLGVRDPDLDALHPDYAIQAWTKSYADSEQLCRACCDAMREMGATPYADPVPLGYDGTYYWWQATYTVHALW